MARKRDVAGTAALVAVLVGALFLRHAHGDPLMGTVAVGRFPTDVAVDEATERVFVVNSGSNSVSLLDAMSGAVVTTIAADVEPSVVVVDERTRRAFVVNARGEFGRSSVSMLNARSGAMLGTTDVGRDAAAAAVDVRTQRVFVADAGDNAVSVLDTRSGALLRTTMVGFVPSAVVVDGRRPHVLVVNQDATVSILSAVTGQLLHTVKLQQKAGLSVAGQLALDGTRQHAFLAMPAGDSVAMLDTATGRLLRTIPVGHQPLALGVDERTARAFVANSGASSVSVIDTRTGAVLRTVRVAAGPGPVAVDARTQRVFVLSGSTATPAAGSTAGGQVTVLDARSGTVLRTLEVGAQPSALGVAERLGRVFVVANGSWVGGATVWSWIPPSLRRLVGGQPRPAPTPPAMSGSASVLDATQ